MTALGAMVVLVSFACGASPASGAAVRISVTDTTDRPVPNAVVYLESADSRSASTPKPATIQQLDKQFVPLVTVIQVGSAVSFPNNDAMRHHVYSFSPPKTFQLKLYGGVPMSPVVFDKPGTVVLGCNIHDHMVAYVQVVDTAYFGKTDLSGKSDIENVPPGPYRLRVWHYAQSDGIVDQSVNIKADGLTLTVRVKLANPLLPGDPASLTRQVPGPP